jgi:hypothetical protein
MKPDFLFWTARVEFGLYTSAPAILLEDNMTTIIPGVIWSGPPGTIGRLNPEGTGMIYTPITELPPNYFNQPSGTYVPPPQQAPNIPVQNIDPMQLAQLRTTQPAHFTTVTEQLKGGNTLTTEYYNPNQYFLTTQIAGRPYEIGVSPGVYGKFVSEPIQRPQDIAKQQPTLEQAGKDIYQNLPLIEKVVAPVAVATLSPRAWQFWGGFFSLHPEQSRAAVYEQYGATAAGEKIGTYQFFTETPAGMAATGIIGGALIGGSASFLGKVAPSSTIASIASKTGQKVANYVLMGTGATIEGSQAVRMKEEGVPSSTIAAKTLGDIGAIYLGTKAFEWVMPRAPTVQQAKPPTIYARVESYQAGQLTDEVGLFSVKAVAQANIGKTLIRSSAKGLDITSPAEIDWNNIKIMPEQKPSISMGGAKSTQEFLTPSEGPIKGATISKTTKDASVGLGFSWLRPVQTNLEVSEAFGINISPKNAQLINLESVKTFGGYVPPTYVRVGEEYFLINRGAMRYATGKAFVIGKDNVLYPVEVSINQYLGKPVSKAEFVENINKKPTIKEKPTKQFRLLETDKNVIDISPPEAAGIKPKIEKNPFGYMKEGRQAVQLAKEEAPIDMFKDTGQAEAVKAASAAVADVIRNIPVPKQVPNILKGRTSLATGTDTGRLWQPSEKDAQDSFNKVDQFLGSGQGSEGGQKLKQVQLSGVSQKQGQKQATAQDQAFMTENEIFAPTTPRIPLPRPPTDMFPFIGTKKQAGAPPKKKGRAIRLPGFGQRAAVPTRLVPKRDILTREFESLNRPVRSWAQPLKPIPQTAKTRAAYGKKLFGPSNAVFRFGPSKKRGR